jgi:tetratricopeptide (TPR) repeat protein
LQATNDLVDLYIALGELDKANELINSVLNPSQSAPQTTPQAKGSKARTNPQPARTSLPNNPTARQYINEIRFNQAEILYYQGFVDSALILYTALLDSLSDDIVNDALKRITFIAQNKEHTEFLSTFAKSEYLAVRGQYSDAVKGFDNVRKSAEGESISELSIIKIAETEIKQNKNSAAKTILTNYLAENAYPLYGDNALFLLGNIAESENNYIDAQKYYGDILYKYPRSFYIADARNKIRTIRGN